MYHGGFLAGRCCLYRLLLEAFSWLLRVSVIFDFATVPTTAAHALWRNKAVRRGIAGSLNIEIGQYNLWFGP
jgi:hypothetical protein